MQQKIGAVIAAMVIALANAQVFAQGVGQGSVAAHNTVRGNINAGNPVNAGVGNGQIPAQPKPAKALKHATEDKTLSAQALSYAKKCVFAHDPNRGRVGENLFVSSITSKLVPPAQVIDAWASEAADYTLSTNSCATGKVCGHYTQVVWANSVKIGCGAALCPNGIKNAFPGQIWVCRYSPPGNFIGQQPYQPAK